MDKRLFLSIVLLFSAVRDSLQAVFTPDVEEVTSIDSYRDEDSIGLSIYDSQTSTPKLHSTLPLKLRDLVSASREVFPFDSDLTISDKTAFFRITPRELVDVKNLNELKSSVDWSEEAVLNRLRIYLDRNVPRPIFYELAGNPQVVSLCLFEKLLPVLIEKAQKIDSADVTVDTSNALYCLLATIEAFLFHRINIMQSQLFVKHLNLLNRVFSKLKRPFIAFFVLSGDVQALKWHQGNFQVNLFGVDKALLMLPKERQYVVASSLFANIIPAFYNTKLHKRIFRDSGNLELCDLLISSCNFNPLQHHDCFRDAKLPPNHPKWDYYRSVYGTKLIDDGFLQTDQIMKPQLVPRKRLPFEIRAVKEEEWKVYNYAYGRLFIDYFKEIHASRK